MKAETYAALLKDLQKLQKALVTEQIKAVRRDPVVAGRMARLHAEAEVGGRVDDFVATAVRKSTVLFLLRTVFVRVLEDLGILGVKRFRDEWGFAAFREVAPALGTRAYFAFVFRDLAVDFPALFVAGEDEVPLPDEDGCRALWNLWHHPNRDGEVYVWNGDGFDSRFLGDLYQDLDADIRKRYALLQTPRFVEEYILDHTMTPALGEFDPAKLRAEGKTFRVLDPTCGSGHFLIGAFHRLADYWRDKHGVAEWQACERALEGVWGCDINPHAVEIAEFRLLLEVVARTGEKDLERLAGIKLNLRAMDSLIPWERAVGQVDLFTGKDRLDAYATPKQRSANAIFLMRDFHAVVGNPPYIAPKDVRKRDDYRAFWPLSCHMRYALSAPFVERLFALGCPGAFTGQITANSFLRRQFGRPLVEDVLSNLDVTGVIDTSGAYIPGHGTPTVVLFGRHRRPQSDFVRTVLGKRGEPKRPQDPSKGFVWTAIKDASLDPDDSGQFVTIARLPRSTLAKHPWSLGGGTAPELLEILAKGTRSLFQVASRFGMLTLLKYDDVYYGYPPNIARNRGGLAEITEGFQVRDYAIDVAPGAIHPYDKATGAPAALTNVDAGYQHLWHWRFLLFERAGTGFRTLRSRGMQFYEYPFRFPVTLSGPVLCLPEVATHAHFVLSRGGRYVKNTCPAIKLPSSAAEEDYLDLLGVLNSSLLEFWGKQIFHCKGYGADSSGARTTADDWENFYQRDSTKLQQAPIATRDRDARIAIASGLDAAAQERATCLPAAILIAGTWTPLALGTDINAARDRFLAHTRRMIALQEELDWLAYGSYNLIDPVSTVSPDAIEPLAPGHRPFEIVLARKDDDAEDDEKSSWWSRHGHNRVTEILSSYSESHRARLQQRIDLIESDARLALLETPPFKRRWELPDWPTETKKAAESWLLDRLEDLFAPATDTTPPGPLAEPKPYRLEDIAVAWSRDPRVAAVAGVWTTTGLSVDLTLVAEKLLRANALPDNPHRLYSDEGLRKLDEWKRVWALQDQEDAWEKAASEAEARGEPKPKLQLVDPDDSTKTLQAIPLPPKLDKTDFVRAEFFSIRGKLNVPRERFILFADLSPHRYGWNGWRNRDRALAQVEAFTLAENDPREPAPVPTSDEPRRCGVTYGLWESLPDVRRWGAAEDHAELSALAREACRQPRCPCPIVEAWKAEVLHGKATEEEPRKTRGGKAAGKATSEAEDKGTKAEGKARRAPAVSLAERAWVASLFSAGKDLDVAGVWARHRGRMVEPSSQGTLPGIGGPPVQLLVLRVDGGGPPPEVASLDEARLLLVLDDLVASGDVQVGGRGKKKRYLLVPRGVSS